MVMCRHTLLMKAAGFLNNPQYNVLAMGEVDNFYPWLLQNGYKSSFSISDSAGDYQILTQNSYDQIAYGLNLWYLRLLRLIRKRGRINMPTMAGHLAAWFLGANEGSVIYV